MKKRSPIQRLLSDALAGGLMLVRTLLLGMMLLLRRLLH